jgi:3-phenylpropionate/cinnamic acid dioxygenase small subunit
MSRASTTDARSAIEHIVYGYAELIDLGDLQGVAALFSHARYKGGGPDDPGVKGSAAVLQILDSMVRRYDDGTPRTKHVLGNIEIACDRDAGTASASCHFAVMQAAPDGPLRAVLAGRYLDTFRLADGRWWFTERVVHPDLIGDLSSHMRRS